MDEDVSLYIRTVFPLERMAITLVLYRRLIQFVILKNSYWYKAQLYVCVCYNIVMYYT